MVMPRGKHPKKASEAQIEASVFRYLNMQKVHVQQELTKDLEN